MRTARIRVEVYRDSFTHRWRWRVIERNGHNLGRYSQFGGYAKRSDAEQACLRVLGAEIAPSGDYVRLTSEGEPELITVLRRY